MIIVAIMAHLLKEKICDICKRGSREHHIHDKEKIAWTNDNEEVITQINRELKIARGGVGAAGNLAVPGTVGGRLAYKGKIGKTLQFEGAFETRVFSD